jgi:CheY-like chemotaxis protein
LKLENRSVLVIDDEVGIRESLGELLRTEGFEIFTAINGREALNKLHENKISPNAILLDLFMPEMNGLEFLMAIRAEGTPSFKKVPVILMTAGSKELGIVQEATVLADDCIRKPLDVDALLSQLKKI